MKKTLLVALAVLLILTVTSVSADVPPGGPFAYVNFDPLNEHPLYADPSSFDYVGSGCFGGDTTGYAVAFRPGTEHPTPPDFPGGGYVFFNWDNGETPRRLELVVLDRGLQDSFYVEMKHPKKVTSWTKVYSYTGEGRGWWPHTITKFPFGLGKGNTKEVSIRIVPSNPGYDAICGQVAVDYVALFTSRN